MVIIFSLILVAVFGILRILITPTILLLIKTETSMPLVPGQLIHHLLLMMDRLMGSLLK